MAYPPQQPTPFNAGRLTRMQVRGRCAVCGYLGAAQVVEEHLGANGVKRVRLPIPPKRCNGCGMRMPALNYEPRRS